MTLGTDSAGWETGADGELMATDRQPARGRGAHPWWRPLAYSAASAAAIAALFTPIPAAAAPDVPTLPVSLAVPDAGSRPIPLGSLVMPGQRTSTPATTAPALAGTPGLPSNPLLTKIEKQRAAIAALGDKLIKLGEDRDLARQQLAVADKKVTDAQAALVLAQRDAATAAANALRDRAALPPGTLGSGLADLDALARMQRGESATEQAASRQLAIVRAAQTAAIAERATATTQVAELSTQYGKLNTEITKKQAALQKLEQKHSAELTAAEAAESAQDRRLGAGYLDGAPDGRGADPRALAAVAFALAQRGDPYVWSEEGPDQYDCSGLMYAAYRSTAAGNFPLMRVSRDQYLQTNKKTVARYSLLPGDLLFFSSTNSWSGIHHVAMYAGNGMMVEAPRTGLTVRLVPVRWSRLFQATRVYGSVEGSTDAPDLSDPSSNPGTPATDPTTTHPRTTPPTKPPTTPTTPTTKPPTSAPTTKPPTTQPTTTPPTTPTTTPPTTTPPTTEPPSDPPTSEGSSSPTGGSSSDEPSSGGTTSSSESTSSSSESTSESASSETSTSTSSESSESASASTSASGDGG